MEKQQLKYHWLLRVLHWVMALIILSLIAVGYYMTGLEKNDPSRPTLYMLHKSFGVTIFFLLLIRLSTRLKTTIPPLPETLSRVEKIWARRAHILLYFFMVVIPFTGYLMSTLSGYAVLWFSIPLPILWDKNPDVAAIMHEFHEIGAYTLLALVFIHVAGVAKHRLYDKKENDVLPRML